MMNQIIMSRTQIYRSCCAFSVYLTLLIVSGKYANAITLYDQPFVASSRGFFSNSGGQVGADQFSLSENSSITSITWYGFYNGSELGSGVTSIDFRVSLFSDASGIPGSEIYDQTMTALAVDTGFQVTAPGTFHDGQIIYEFMVDAIPSISVTAGDITWLSLVEYDPITPATESQWLWNFSSFSSVDSKALSTDPFQFQGFGWGSSSQFGNLAFTLAGTPPVPEPSTMILLGSGVICFIAYNYRNRKRSLCFHMS